MRNMCKLLMFSMLLILIFTSSGSASGLSLTDLINSALEKNHSILSGMYEIEHSNILISQAGASQDWRSDLLIDAGTQKLPEQLKNFYSSADIDIGSSYNVYSGTLVVSKILFPTEDNKMLLDQAKKGSLSSYENLRLRKLDIVSQVVEAYYDLFRIKDALTLAEETAGVIKNELTKVEHRVSTGVSTKKDIDEKKLELTRANSSIVIAQNSLGLAEQRLTLLTGISLNIDDLKSPNIDVDYEGLWSELSLEDIQNMALKNRPEINQTDIGIQIAKSQLGAAERSKSPSFTLEGNYIWGDNSVRAGFSIDSDYRFIGTITKFDTSLPDISGLSDEDWDNTSDWWNEYFEDLAPEWNPDRDELEEMFRNQTGQEDSWEIMLGANFNIFDSHLTESIIDEKKIDLEKASVLREQVLEGIKLEVAAIYFELNQCIVDIQIAEKAYNMALDREKDVMILMDTGMVSLTELDMSRLGVLQARNVFNQQIYDFETAKARLLTAIGFDIYTIISYF